MATAFTLAASTPRIFFRCLLPPATCCRCQTCGSFPSSPEINLLTTPSPHEFSFRVTAQVPRPSSVSPFLARLSSPFDPRFLHLIIRVLTRAAAHLSKVSWLFFIFKIQNHMFGPGPGHSVQHTCLSSSSRFFPPTSTLTASSSTYDGTIMMAIMC